MKPKVDRNPTKPQMLSRTKQRSDVIMIVICTFVFAGGVLVFQSFAAQKLDTTSPGAYDISNIQQITNQTKSGKTTTTYTLALNNELEYCLWGNHGDKVSLTETDTISRIPTPNSVEYSAAHATRYVNLFPAPTSSDKAKATFEIVGDVQVTNLMVSLAGNQK